MSDRSGYTTIEPTLRRAIRWAFMLISFGFILGIIATVIGVYTNAWQRLGGWVWSCFMANWWLFLAVPGTIIVVGWLVNKIIK